MRMQRLTVLLVMALCLLLASCGTGDSAGTSSAQSSRALLPISLRNPSPRQLEAAISVAIGGYDRTSRDMTSIRLAFGFHERTVQFAGNEHLMCNGTAIPLHDQIASFQIAEAPTRTLEGRTFTCTYSASGASATLTFTVPQAPAILSPQDQARVPRGTHTLITYEVQGGKGLGIVALGPGVGPGGKAIAQLDTPRNLQATVNTSAFPPGAGTIALTQQLAPQVTQTGMPFASLFTGGTAVAMIAVTWV